MKINIRNTFHNTEINVMVEDYLKVDAVDHNYMTMLSYYAQEPNSKERVKYNMIQRALCGSKECMCGRMVREKII